MNAILMRLLGGINLADLILLIYKSGGEDAVRRFLTTPEGVVKRICARTGADVAKALEERNEAVQETLEFFESLTDKDFEDPDTEVGGG